MTSALFSFVNSTRYAWCYQFCKIPKHADTSLPNQMNPYTISLSYPHAYLPPNPPHVPSNHSSKHHLNSYALSAISPFNQPTTSRPSPKPPREEVDENDSQKRQRDIPPDTRLQLQLYIQIQLQPQLQPILLHHLLALAPLFRPLTRLLLPALRARVRDGAVHGCLVAAVHVLEGLHGAGCGFSSFLFFAIFVQ